MDRETLSQYGWVTICIIIIVILIALATPFGNYIYAQAENAVVSLGGKVKETFASANINYDTPAFGESSGTIPGNMSGGGSVNQQGGNNTPTTPSTAYTLDQINADDHLFAIGATQPEYVVARYNDDYTELTVMKNGENSDGLMIDFKASYQAAEQAYKTVHGEAEITELIYSIAEDMASSTPYDIPRKEHYVLDGFSNSIEAELGLIAEEGMANGKFDSSGEPIDESAFAWAQNKLLEATDGCVGLDDSFNLTYPKGVRGMATYIFKTSNKGFSLRESSGANISSYTFYKFTEAIGGQASPTCIADALLETINIMDGVTVNNCFCMESGFSDSPITINVSSSVVLSDNAFGDSYYTLVQN